jgi:hypothetical protein
MAKHTTLREIREMVRGAYGETGFYAGTNKTMYPAAWRYGDGAGDASTSCPYDCRLQLAAEHVAGELGLPPSSIVLDDVVRQRDAAAAIAAALREQATADAAEDATADEAIERRSDSSMTV